MLTIQQELSEIVSVIEALLPGAKVYLFGSYANGEQSSNSDLDLCIVAPAFSERRMDTLYMIRDAIKDMTNLPLDILAYTDDEFMNHAMSRSTIQYSILNKGILLNG